MLTPEALALLGVTALLAEMSQVWVRELMSAAAKEEEGSFAAVLA